MILGIYTQLLGPGGVQGVGRLSAACLASFAERRGETFRCFGFNDTQGTHWLAVGGIEYEVSGFGRSAGRLLRAALQSLPRASMAYLGHAHLAPVGMLLKLLKPGLRCWPLLHGIEAWTPLPFFTRLGLKMADGVISVSSFTAVRAAEAQRIPPSRFKVMPTAIDPALEERSSRTSHARGGKREGKVLLTVGRLAASEQYKGVDTVIRALPQIRQSVPDVRYVVAGEGNDRRRLERLAQEAGVADCVLFVGERTQEELCRDYETSDVFVMPSRGEGLGVAFLEAMAFGKPVIAGNHGGAPEVVIHGVTGFLVEGSDPSALAEGAIQLLCDGVLRKRMGDAGRRCVEGNFCFRHFQRRMDGFLEGVMR